MLTTVVYLASETSLSLSVFIQIAQPLYDAMAGFSSVAGIQCVVIPPDYSYFMIVLLFLSPSILIQVAFGVSPNSYF